MTESSVGINALSELGTPSFLREDYDSGSGETIRWVGIRTTGPDGVEGDFLLWQSFTCNMEDPLERYDAASILARIKVGLNVKAVIGYPVDISETIKTGKIAVIHEPNVWAIYVEADKRRGLSFTAFMEGIKDEITLRTEKPVEFDEAFQNAKRVIPDPVGDIESDSVSLDE